MGRRWRWWVGSKRRRGLGERLASVAFDGEGVRHERGDGASESVRWEELREVCVLTTDGGPYVDDVFWVLVGREGGCAIPSETAGMGELLSRLQRLPGFDNEAVIRAMASTENATFVCWRRGEAGE